MSRVDASQQRADLCGREGFPLAVTPYVDQLAQENVWFNKAYTVAPASSPARCSMFTGRFPSAIFIYLHKTRCFFSRIPVKNMIDYT